MPRLRIDGRDVQVAQGATVLDACRALGIPVPAMCLRAGLPPTASCMVCLVMDTASGRLLPSCAAPAADGMALDAASPAVLDARRMALELLLSEHVGDCEGLCRRACPARLDIPAMLRLVAAGDVAAAARTALDDLALPSVLGRICPAPCEKACRRARHDGALAIRLAERLAGDALATAAVPPAPPATTPGPGRKVAVVGAGPAGISAAWHLARTGRACSLLDRADSPGGGLRESVPETDLPREVLDREIARVLRSGVSFLPRSELGRNVTLAGLQRDHDAVILALGAVEPDQIARIGLQPPQGGAPGDPDTLQTGRPGVFACRSSGRERRMAVHAVAAGRTAAQCADRFLRGEPPRADPRPFDSVVGRLEEGEMREFLRAASADARTAPASPAAGFSEAEARREAARCLRCDCRKARGCLLRKFADECGARQNRYRGRGRAPVRIVAQHAEVVYEPGKCIRCGLCVAICERAREPLGLTFIGRGFDVQVGAPFGESMDRALTAAAAECVAACPTGALAFRDGAGGLREA